MSANNNYSTAWISETNKIPTLLILVATYFFFPAGILLMFYRMYKHESHSYRSARDVKLLAWVVLLSYFRFLFWYYTDGDVPSPFLTLGIILVSVMIYFNGRSKVKEVKNRFNQYIQYIVFQREYNIYDLARWLSQTPELAAKEIIFLFEKEILPKGFVDLNTMTVALEGHPLYNQAMATNEDLQPSVTIPLHVPNLPKRRTRKANLRPIQSSPVSTVPSGPRTVVCSGCGAKNQLLPDIATNCEYCGGPVNYPVHT